MAHPATYFLRYLVVAQDDIAQASIDSTLALHGLAPASEDEVALARHEVADIPEDFRGWDKTHAASRAWLRKQRIYSLFHPDAATVEMKTDILEAPRTRDRVDTLVIGNVSDAEASYRLQKLGVALSGAAIAEYRHYFWNPGVMALSDWAEYFARDAYVPPEDVEGAKTLRSAGSGRTGETHEFLRAALQGGAELAKYRAGVHIEVDSRKLLQDLMRELNFTFLEVRTLPLSMKKVEMLAALSRGIVRVDERLSQGDQAVQDTLKRFEKFKVLGDESKVPSLAKLAPAGTVSARSRQEILATRER